ncbi:hypothetical protein [Pseudomonas cichorii]|uniref:hypothetical protein n=1 Tax=Pseudomonas cichorii TaxID=36746 RepID=UPI0016054608|nr:hypothetical protein [Pseudomonas cichorii]
MSGSNLKQFDLFFWVDQATLQQLLLKTLRAPQRLRLTVLLRQVIDCCLIDKGLPWRRLGHNRLRQPGNRLIRLIAFITIAGNIQRLLISFTQPLKAVSILIGTVVLEQTSILPFDTALVGTLGQRQNRPTISHHGHLLHLKPPKHALQPSFPLFRNTPQHDAEGHHNRSRLMACAT